MSVNKSLPHLLVLPEDKANSQLAKGFHLELDLTRQRRLQVLPVAGGWSEVLERFSADHLVEMERYPERSMVLLLDFDQREDRFAKAKAVIPKELEARVFILGAWSEPEDLRKDGLGTYEAIGQALAKDCREGTAMTWGYRLLCHNADELDRLRQQVCAILYPPI